MLDDCADTAESRLEGRKPVGRLLPYVQKYLGTVYRPLCLLCRLSGPPRPWCNRMCSLELEALWKNFGMSFFPIARCDLQGGRNSGVACEIEEQPRGVCSHFRDSVKPWSSSRALRWIDTNHRGRRGELSLASAQSRVMSAELRLCA